MSLFLNPLDYGLEHDGRLVIYNVKSKSYYDWRTVKKGTPVDISDKQIVSSIIDFKFKFQERKDNKWVDVKNYFYLEKSRFIRQFWTGKITLENKEIEHMIEYFSTADLSKYYEIIKDAVSRTINYIMKIRQPQFRNLKLYFNTLEKMDVEVPLIWKNINVYLKELLEIKELFYNEKFIGISYVDLKNKIQKDKELNNYFQGKIDYLTSLNMQFPDVLAGIVYSFLGDRKSAALYINRALEYNNDYIQDFNLGLGIHTYINETSPGEFNNNINFDYQTSFPERDVTFAVSVDETFLRKYGMQMFYSIIALKKYHFHFHVIIDDNKADSVIKESQMVFDSMTKFFNTKETVVSPTFSSEEIPKSFVNKTTYFACARFVNAGKFIDKFKSDIVTLDADFVITDDLQKMINEITKNDVALTITTGFTSFVPWTRFMGGTLYIKNNAQGKNFLKETRDYILSNREKKNTWTLDQNALCYAFESASKNMKIGDISGYPRPLTQPNIRRFIED